MDFKIIKNIFLIVSMGLGTLAHANNENGYMLIVQKNNQMVNDSIYIDYCDSLYCHPTELVQKCLGDNIVILSNNGDLVFEIRQNVGVVKFFNKNEYWYLVE